MICETFLHVDLEDEFILVHYHTIVKLTGADKWEHIIHRQPLQTKNECLYFEDWTHSCGQNDWGEKQAHATLAVDAWNQWVRIFWTFLHNVSQRNWPYDLIIYKKIDENIFSTNYDQKLYSFNFINIYRELALET